MKTMTFPIGTIRLLNLAMLTAVACSGAMASSALQFDASISRSVSKTDGYVVAWVSTRGGVIASPCHTNGRQWHFQTMPLPRGLPRQVH